MDILTFKISFRKVINIQYLLLTKAKDRSKWRTLEEVYVQQWTEMMMMIYYCNKILIICSFLLYPV